MARQLLTPIRLVPLSSPPGSPAEGDTYYDTVSDTIRVYDGTSWSEGWVDVQTFTYTGDLPASYTGLHRYYVDTAMTVLDVRASVSTAPTGQSVIVDVHRNGTTIFTTQGNRPTIAAGTNTDVSGTPDVTALSAGDYLTVDIDQAGSGTTGANLTVQVRLKRRG